MCVIITAQAGAMPTISQLAEMSDTNPDGAGIAWHDGTRLHRYRQTDNRLVLAYILTHWRELEEHPFLAHFRLATHGAVIQENTHPFAYRLPDGNHGYIAHNGVATRFTRGRYANDSRNAVLAWQDGKTDLSDGNQGQFATIDATGRITWLTGQHQRIRGGIGMIDVSNTHWETSGLLDLDSWWDDGYEQGWSDACAEHGITPDTPHNTYPPLGY
ncbi:class II glutamine amidotransferase [Bifidobacterium biavatii]|uniref:Class II glutamine amidotransferase domain protein n=1 Tax=Bifidobacterium biavatii DSM 23969 TaxID=1437608 RepID=A0A086ZHX5_9BIFI|nr:class II glutamine amidotransferase [Bifidobacterium biavatii]KFI46125.1 class II glutamine amidotransferase domain protein [Bifidobacterium biavatii DSM 23969]